MTRRTRKSITVEKEEIRLREGVTRSSRSTTSLASFQIARVGDFLPLGESQSTEPGGAITWYVSGPQGATVTCSLARLNASGGHSHSGGPVGSVSPQSFTLGKYPQNIPVVFRAPDASGRVDLTARFSSGSPSEITVYNNVLVSGLLALGQSTRLSLVGTTTTHPSNHWGTGAMCGGLAELGRHFHEKFKKPIFVNDMSLEIGGLFDHKATFAPPHQLHRDGRHVDLNYSSMNKKERDFFKATAESLGFRVEIHPDPEHWHLIL